jgi:hypothetical protein
MSIDVVPDMRTVSLTPLAHWVLTHTCGKPVVRRLARSKTQRTVFKYADATCMRLRGHTGDCSPTMEQGDERG